VTTFIALYRGATIAGAQLVAATSDPALVAAIAIGLLDDPPNHPPTDDAALDARDGGQRQALRIIRDEAERQSRRPTSETIWTDQ
jgi:hypothetical protein